MKYVPVSNKSGSYDSAKPDMETNKEIERIVDHITNEWDLYCQKNEMPDLHRISFGDILKRTTHFVVSTSYDQAEARGAEKERERCAQVVENWHISKGGYGNMANFIRENQTPNHE